MEMRQDFLVCLQRAKQDSIKFLTISGAGELFCASGDFNVLRGGLTPEEAFALLYSMKEVLYQIVTFPVPTICLLNEDALVGGL
jgi:enoyl-CoA hydratase